MGYIGGLLAAGIALAYLLLGDPKLLFTSTYGNVLLAKLAAVCLLLLLGATNKFRLVPSLLNDPQAGPRRLRKSIHFEMILSLFILATTGFLTTSVSLPG
jgi:putative copper resistance protein D